MPEHVLAFNYLSAGEQLGGSVHATAELEIKLDVTIAADRERKIALNLPVAQCKGLCFESATPMTLRTNTGQTINLSGRSPVAWLFGSEYACPLTKDVSLITVNSKAGGTLKIR